MGMPNVLVIPLTLLYVLLTRLVANIRVILDNFEQRGNYSAGGSKGPVRPLGGVRGSPTLSVPALLPHPAGGGARETRPE